MQNKKVIFWHRKFLGSFALVYIYVNSFIICKFSTIVLFNLDCYLQGSSHLYPVAVLLLCSSCELHCIDQVGILVHIHVLGYEFEALYMHLNFVHAT